MSTVVQGEQRRLPITQRAIVHLDIVENMALDNKRILPAVIIKVLQSDSPTRGLPRKHAKTRLQFLRAERSPAVIVKKDIGFVRKLGNEKVRKSIVIVILKNDTHTREHLSVFRKRHTGIQTAFGERAVSVVV